MGGLGLRGLGAKGLVLIAVCLVVLRAAGAEHHVDLHMTVGTISWVLCSQWKMDPDFPQICSTPAPQPLEVAVTIDVSWTIAPLRERDGPAMWVEGGATNDFVLLSAASKFGGQAKIAYRPQGAEGPGAETLIPYAPGPYAPMEGYAFKSATSLPPAEFFGPNNNTIDTRFVFTMALSTSGVYEVYFEHCCRYTELLNINPDVYPAEVPWHLMATVRVADDSYNAPALSPKVVMPYSQVNIRRKTSASGDWMAKRGFRLYAPAQGDVLSTKVSNAAGMANMDISGEYYQMDSNYHINKDTAVTAGGPYASYKRVDGHFAIVWFDCPSQRPQFQDTGAYASEPAWVVVQGSFDQPDRIGLKPSEEPVILEAIGGQWDEKHVAQGWHYIGPSYVEGSIETYVGGVAGLVVYDNMVKVQAIFAQDMFMPPFMDPGRFGTMTYTLTGAEGIGKGYSGPGTLANPFDYSQMPGLFLDPETGHLLVEEAAWLQNCDTKYSKNGFPSTGASRVISQTCYIAVTVDVGITCPDGVMIHVPVDFWIEILRWQPMATIGVPIQQVPMAQMSQYTPHRVNCSNGTLVNLDAQFFDVSGTMLNRMTDALIVGVPPLPNVGDFYEFEAACSARGLYMVCMRAMVGMPATGPSMIHTPDSMLVVKSKTAGCYFVEIVDDMAMPPPVVPLPTPAPEMVTTMAPPPPPATPPPLPTTNGAINVLNSATVLQDIEAQIKMGSVNVQFVKDVDTLPYASNMQLHITQGVCAGGRDLVLQRQIIDSWNAAQNEGGNYDSKYRSLSRHYCEYSSAVVPSI